MKNILLLLNLVSSFTFGQTLSMETFDKSFEGAIGNYKIKMLLINRFGNISGHYNYLKNTNESISLFGKKLGKKIELSEENIEGNIPGEKFMGFYVNDSVVTGNWTKGKKRLSFKLIELKEKSTIPIVHSFSDLSKYIGLSPWQSEFFISPFVQNKFKSILKNEWKDFYQFLDHTAYYNFEKDGKFIECGFWYEHIGCTGQSMLIIDTENKTFNLCWLKDDCHDIHIYSDSELVSKDVLEYFSNSLNQGWGHVAQFKAEGEKIICTEK